MRVIANIEGEDIVERDDKSVQWTAKMAVDSDGVGPHHGDRTAEDETSLKIDGVSLNADVDKYVVVPPAIIQGVEGVVLGCKARVLNTGNGVGTDAVVGDEGPHHKLGEAACVTAAAVGLNPSPVDGGTSDHIIQYTIWPGVPAVVDGKTYPLQPGKLCRNLELRSSLSSERLC
jgi:hypothetical protein